MLYKTIRICLKNLDQLISSLHQAWLLLPRYIQISKKYDLVSPSGANAELLKSITGAIEQQFIPIVHNISLGGFYKRKVSDRELWKFNNAGFQFRSNFVRFSDGTTYNPKILSNDNLFHLSGDSDLVRVEELEICHLTVRKRIVFDSILHITGVNSNNWGHFLVEYFPKLFFLEFLSQIEPSLKIALFEGTDSHIIRMIEDAINIYPSMELVFVPVNVEVHARSLFYVVNDSYIADEAAIQSITHVRLSDSTVDYILNFYNTNYKHISKNFSRRLFIGRTGSRSISNYDEVLNLFNLFGFEEVFPHLLTFDEKIQVFSEAEFISGPLSSGFANVLFAPNVKSVLTLTNCTRHFDSYISKLSHTMNFRSVHYLGRQLNPFFVDSEFEIDTKDLYLLLCSFFGKP